MPDKSRTPPPPRRVQAPKQRSSPRTPRDAARRRSLLMYGLAGAGIIGLTVVLVVIFAGGGKGEAGSPSAVRATMEQAGCTFTSTKGAPSAQHIGNLTDSVKYLTFPPVSGGHYGVPALWGNYSQTVDPRQAVHNQEHGGIVVWTGPRLSAADRVAIGAFYDSSPNGVLVTPLQDRTKGITYPKHEGLGSRVALTAWTASVGGTGTVSEETDVIAICPRYDEAAFTRFRDEFRGKGPERFPIGEMLPGS